jgi:RNA recognition motif-containing protein
VKRPQYEIDRILQNLQENKEPSKVYVGNIAFECSEQDIYEEFSKVGIVGDVSLVRDEDGKNRGFGFVTMRTNEQGQAAIDKLKDKPLLINSMEPISRDAVLPSGPPITK